MRRAVHCESSVSPFRAPPAITITIRIMITKMFFGVEAVQNWPNSRRPLVQRSSAARRAATLLTSCSWESSFTRAQCSLNGLFASYHSWSPRSVAGVRKGGNKKTNGGGFILRLRLSDAALGESRPALSERTHQTHSTPRRCSNGGLIWPVARSP
jgi:hypothetical protein